VIKNLAFLGALLPILGPPRTAPLFVPIPCRENHSLKIGDAKIGVQAETSDELPPAVGVALVAGGGFTLVLR